MLDLTFGEQVKIILSRKGMTIKELAEIIEERTGKKMSRQNLTQRCFAKTAGCRQSHPFSAVNLQGKVLPNDCRYPGLPF